MYSYMYSLFLYIFAVRVSGAICTPPQEYKLQSTAIGFTCFSSCDKKNYFVIQCYW
jgi:hypothetical protein